MYKGLTEFREHGLLWLINTAALHPRGYALTFQLDENGEVEGWFIRGDGKEPWQFGEPCDDEFNAVLALLAESSG
jgi:hypothetical protein